MSSCAVCGDKVNGSRYGAPACLGCIVFFRRAVFKEAKYKCLKTQNCVINNESRCICRFCRLQKCLTVGMNPEAIQRRDVMGPRKKKPREEEPSSTDVPITEPQCMSVASSSGNSTDSVPPVPTPMLDGLARLQDQQQVKHRHISCMMDDTLTWGEKMFESINVMTFYPPFRRARKRDVNFMLRTAIMNAAQWANQFKPFREISHETKKSILAEYGLAFMLVDQGALTALRSDDELWLLQNNTFMSPDYLKGLPDADKKDKQTPTKAKLHPEFVTDALQLVGKPMRQLQIDGYECATLKTILLLGHCASADKYFFGSEQLESVTKLQNRLISELMIYCRKKCADEAVERVGSVLLLTSSIRYAIRSLYHQTRVSDIFNLMTFDPLIRDVFLT